MARRTLQFFMRPLEFEVTLREFAAARGLILILERYSLPDLEVAAQTGRVLMSDGRPPDELFVATEFPDPSWLRPRDMHPAIWGWAAVDMPREVGNLLFMSQMGCQSDWLDQETGQHRENATSLQTFSYLARGFKKKLRRPVWAGGVLTRDLWYSEGAAAWVAMGGRLCQVGAARDKPTNVEFRITPPSDVSGPVPDPTPGLAP